MDGILKVEFVIRLAQVKEVPAWVDEVFKDARVLKTQSRYVYDVDGDWEGFRDGTIVKLLEEFNESLYVALAYLTPNAQEIVTDFDGNEVDRFEEVMDGKKIYKYVKKRLMIKDIISEEDETFEIKAYVLNLDYTEPIVKVLDVYSIGKLSGVTLDIFGGKK